MKKSSSWFGRLLYVNVQSKFLCASQKVRTLSSQVLIYHNPETFKDFSIQEPDCLGNLIATNYIITAASCFMFTFEILKYSETNNKRPTESEENAIVSRSIKNIDIKKTRIVKVNVNYSVCILVRIDNENHLGFHMRYHLTSVSLKFEPHNNVCNCDL